MKYECAAVRAFHIACDVPARSIPGQPAIKDEEVRLRLRLCNEEPRELMQALIQGDLVETADGIADTMVVTAGTLVQFGVEVEASDVVAAAVTLVKGSHEVLTKTIQATNLEELPQAASVMYLVCLGISSAFGIPYRAVFDAVHDSNMEKVDPATGKCVKDAGGKILKPTQWPEPQPWTPPTERIKALLGKWAASPTSPSPPAAGKEPRRRGTGCSTKECTMEDSDEKIIIGDLAWGRPNAVTRDQLLWLQLKEPARFINMQQRPIPFACAALPHTLRQQRDWARSPGPV